jgi:hypothetical protein
MLPDIPDHPKRNKLPLSCRFHRQSTRESAPY